MENSPLRISTPFPAPPPPESKCATFRVDSVRPVLPAIWPACCESNRSKDRGRTGHQTQREAKRRAAMMIAATFLGIIGAIVVVTFLNRIP